MHGCKEDKKKGRPTKIGYQPGDEAHSGSLGSSLVLDRMEEGGAHAESTCAVFFLHWTTLFVLSGAKPSSPPLG